MMAKAATTGIATSGALTMAVFSLATVPALYATGLAGAWIPASRRLWMQRAGGLVVVLMGVITLARSAIAFSLLDPTILTAGIDLLCRPF